MGEEESGGHRNRRRIGEREGVEEFNNLRETGCCSWGSPRGNLRWLDALNLFSGVGFALELVRGTHCPRPAAYIAHASVLVSGSMISREELFFPSFFSISILVEESFFFIFF